MSDNFANTIYVSGFIRAKTLMDSNGRCWSLTGTLSRCDDDKVITYWKYKPCSEWSPSSSSSNSNPPLTPYSIDACPDVELQCPDSLVLRTQGFCSDWSCNVTVNLSKIAPNLWTNGVNVNCPNCVYWTFKFDEENCDRWILYDYGVEVINGELMGEDCRGTFIITGCNQACGGGTGSATIS